MSEKTSSPDRTRWGFWPALPLGLLLVWVFWPTFGSLARRWATQPQYSHGYVVPLFALYLLWSRRSLIPATPGPFRWLGLLLLMAGLALHFSGVALYYEENSEVALLPCLAGAFLVVGGWGMIQWSWPALLFLLFMMPLPYRVETALSVPLQKLATVTSTFTLQTLGMAAFAEGNIIWLGEMPIHVAQACNGLSMLIVFFAMSTAMTMIFPLTLPEKILIIASAIPIALISNVVRIVVTAILFQISTAETAHFFFHDVAGWLMMVFALILLWIELRLLSWVLIPIPETDSAQQPLLGLVPDRTATAHSVESAPSKPTLTKA